MNLKLKNGYTIEVKSHTDNDFTFSFSQSADIDTVIGQLTKDNLSQCGYYIGDTLDTLITDKIVTCAQSNILKKEVIVVLGSAIDAEKAALIAEVTDLRDTIESLVLDEIPAIYDEIDSLNE